ncbi:MAG TPA: hypothetical protein VLK65_20305 [Vicinamibacteria bacterium]|nr:hypothetical protein [Vicinamibacteria bacterium]
MDTSYLRSVLIAGILAIISSCGGGAPRETSSEAPHPGVDVCSFLTAAEIEEALGRAPGEPRPGSEGITSCTWAAPDGSGSLVQLVLRNTTLSSYEDFVSEYGEEFGGENPPRDRFRPLEGPGDWSLYVADDNAIRVFRGEEELTVISEAAEKDEEVLMDLAEKAVAHWS